MTSISKIRKEYFVNKKSVHQIALEQRLSWATVKTYVTTPMDQIKDRGKRPSKTSHVVTEEVRSRIRFYLYYEKVHNIKRKQRFTAAYMYHQLVDDGVFKGSERYFRKIVTGERHLINQEKNPVKSFLELDFPLGEFLQFDHGPVEIEWNGVQRDAYLFVATVPGHSLRYAQLYLTKASESWGDFHEKAFRYFGGVFPNCIYDNDSVLKSGDNKTSYFLEITNHYDFKSVFCNKAAGWEKGSVENGVGFCRRNYMPGRPEVVNLVGFNEILEKKCFKEIEAENNGRPLKKFFEQLKTKVKPLNNEWEWGVWRELKINSLQYINFQCNCYSVPEKYVGANAKVYITPTLIKIMVNGESIAIHDRSFEKDQRVTQLDHYLDQLGRKPTAIPFSMAMKEEFPPYMKDLRERLRNRFDLKRGDLEFIEILKLRRNCSNEDFRTSVELAISYGGITSSAIKSFIDQLQIGQKNITLPQEYLPSECRVNIKSDFKLDSYLQLCEPVGGVQ